MNFRYIVAGVVQDGDKIILGRKSKGRPPYPDLWHTPGGGVEDSEKAKRLYDAKDYDNEFFHAELRRELKEELGVDVKNIKNIIPQYRDIPREGETESKHGEMTHYYFLEFLCDYARGQLKASDDLAEVKLVSKSDLKNIKLTPPSQSMYRELGWI